MVASQASKLDRKQKGLTLLELVVDVTILSILIGFLFLLIDPFSQLSKAEDTTRKHDLEQIKNALDTYYNDTGCYPNTVPFGSEWKVDNTVYMRIVPQDPDCKGNLSSCYSYQFDTSDPCPQWNILYAQQEKSQPESCTLNSLTSSCVPPDYNDNLACNLSGNVDCSFVNTHTAFTSVVPPSPSSSPGSSQPATPTPIACPQSQKHYSCTGSPARCNVVPAGTGTYCSINCDGACL